MRRVGILILLAVVVVVGAVLLLRKPKAGSARAKSKTKEADTSATVSGTPARPASAGRGKTVGRIKAKTKEERLAEKKKRREEERKRRKEMKRRERERRRMLKYARSKRGSRKSGARKGTYFVVKAIVSLGNESYALIDSRRVRVGDVIMGRRVVDIKPDRIEIEAFGRVTTVRVGESILPPGYFIERKGRL